MMPLKRLVISLNLEAIAPLGELLSKFYRRNSSMELLQTLFISEDVVAELVRIRRAADFYTVDEIGKRREELMKKYNLLDFEVIDASLTAGSYTAIIKHVMPPKLSPVLKKLGGSVYLASPIGISRGTVTLTLFVEKDKAGSLAELLGQQGIDFRIHSVTDAFGTGKTENRLSASQLSLIQLASAMGYFDVPRRASTDDVARIAGVTAPAVSKTIRRVEKMLVERLLNDTSLL